MDPLVELAELTQHLARKLRGYLMRDLPVVPLSPLECLVLLHVDRHPGISPSRLAAELSLTSSNTASALRGLIDTGQLERSPDPADRRGACLRVTQDAATSIVLVRRFWRELLSDADVTEDEVRAALRTLQAVNSVIDEV